MIKSYGTVRILAQKLLAEAYKNEPQITADLEKIAREVSAEIVGLENKFKAEVSLIRKLNDLAEADSADVAQIAEKFNDALRYTFVLPFDTYAVGFRQTIEKLKEADYEIPEGRIWNAWKNIETRFDRGYRGINMTVISSRKQKFELQFHTAESFAFKTANHHLYKESKSRRVSRERKKEIAGYLVKAADEIAVPKGVK